MRIAEALIEDRSYDLADDIQEMRELRENQRLGPSTASIIDEVYCKGNPLDRLNKYSLCQLGYGCNQVRVQATVTSKTSSIGATSPEIKKIPNFYSAKLKSPAPKEKLSKNGNWSSGKL